MTLEHLLFAMTEDEDVMKILNDCNINISALKDELENFLKNNLNDLISDSQEEVKPTLGFQRVIQRAVIHVSLLVKRKLMVVTF